MDDYTNTGIAYFETINRQGQVQCWEQTVSFTSPPLANHSLTYGADFDPANAVEVPCGNQLVGFYPPIDQPWYQDLWNWWLGDIFADDYGFAVLFGLIICLFMTIGAVLFVIQVIWPAVDWFWYQLREGDRAADAYDIEEYIDELNMSAAGGHPYHALSQM